MRLFISHLATNRRFAAELQTALSQYGITSFVAHNDIEPTSEWQTEIEKALLTCDALVALLHEGFHQSKWTDQEIGFAMGRRVPAFSIQLGEFPYGFIGRFQAFNGSNKTAKDLAKEMFDALRKNRDLDRKMSEAIIQLFEESGSFAEAKTRVTYLENIGFWDASFSQRLRTAVKNNSQTYEFRLGILKHTTGEEGVKTTHPGQIRAFAFAPTQEDNRGPQRLVYMHRVIGEAIAEDNGTTFCAKHFVHHKDGDTLN